MRDPEGSHGSQKLTTRQREVLQLLAEGRLMKEAAYILGLSRRTIAFQKYRIYERLGLSSLPELIQFAIETHVVYPQSHAFVKDHVSS